jgi:hypothetical protein
MTLRDFVQTAPPPMPRATLLQPQLASLEETEAGLARVFGDDWKALGHLCWSALDGWHIVTKDERAGVLLIRQTRRFGVFMRIGVLEVRKNDSCVWDEFVGPNNLMAILDILEPREF